MARTKLQFYKTNSETQRRADISIELYRLDSGKMKQWSVSEKLMAKAFLHDMESRFDAFKKEIETHIQ